MRFCLLVLIFIAPSLQADDSLLISLDLPDDLLGSVRMLSWSAAQRPRIGLALSGGGARGMAHIGVLKVLEQEGIHVDYIAGTSIGSVIGGLYAAGYSADELEKLALSIDWDTIFRDTPPRTTLFPSQKEKSVPVLLAIRFDGWRPQLPQALTAGQKLTNLMIDLTMEATYQARGDFDQLPVPYRAVATDLLRGTRVVLKRGDLAEAMRASMAIPLIFTPVERDTLLLVDGGLVDIVPVDAVWDMGADVVFAVDVTSPLTARDLLDNPISLANQVATIVFCGASKEQLARADVVISPSLGGHSSLDYRRIVTLVELGEAATLSRMEEIREAIGISSTRLRGQRFPLRLVDTSSLGPAEEDSLLRVISRDRSIYTNEIQDMLRHLYSWGRFRHVSAVLKGNEIDGFALSFLLDELPTCSSVVLSGHSLFDEGQLREVMHTTEGTPLNYRLIGHDLTALMDLYHQAGYSLARIKEASLEGGRFFVEIDEGRLARVDLEGHRRTRRWVVLRYFPLRTGDIFDAAEANVGVANAYGTGLFEKVTLKIKDSPGGPILVVHVKERGAVHLLLGGHYWNDLGWEGLVEFGDANVFGIGNEASLRLLGGRRREELRLDFRADRIWRSYLTYRLGAFLRREKHWTYAKGEKVGEYRDRRIGLRFSFGEQLERLGTASVEGRGERIEIFPVSGVDCSSEVIEHRSFLLHLLLDSVDRRPFPTSGVHQQLTFEFAGHFLGGATKFTKASTSLESYHTWWTRHTLCHRLAIGVCDASLPFVERFILGGRDSLMGYHQDELRGNFLFSGSLSYRVTFLRRFHGMVTYQIGEVWQDRGDVNLNHLRRGIGLGLVLETFGGPIELDYGFGSGGRRETYFSFGFSF